MGYYVFIDRFSRSLATFTGWKELKLFVADQPSTMRKAIDEFIDEGGTENVAGVLDEIELLLQRNPPSHVASTLRDWKETIETGPENPHEMILSLGDDDDDDDDEDEDDFDDEELDEEPGPGGAYDADGFYLNAATLKLAKQMGLWKPPVESEPLPGDKASKQSRTEQSEHSRTTRSAGKKSTAGKSATPPSTAKRAAPKKAGTKKSSHKSTSDTNAPATKKSASMKSATKNSAAQKAATKKAAAKGSTGKTSASKKTPAKSLPVTRKSAPAKGQKSRNSRKSS